MSNDPWRNARAMHEKDTCARTMGIELIEMDDGFAQMTMTVSPDMLNGHQTCHGGQLFKSDFFIFVLFLHNYTLK